MRRPLVLHADPHSDTRLLLSYLLDLHGIGVVEADNGVSAFDLVLRERPDLVVTELTLPLVDGCDLVKRIRSHSAIERLPLIAWTAAADAQSQARAQAAGFDRVVVKAGDSDIVSDVLALLRTTGGAV